MQKAKQVSPGFTHGSHLGEDWQVVDNEGHFIALLLGQVPCVPDDPEAGDVGGSMCVELVH